MRFRGGASRLFSGLAALLCLFQVVSLVSRHTMLRTNPELGFDALQAGSSKFTSALAVSPSFFDCFSELLRKGRAVQLLRRIALASYHFPDFLDVLEVSGSRQLEGTLYFCRAVTHPSLSKQRWVKTNEARGSLEPPGLSSPMGRSSHPPAGRKLAFGHRVPKKSPAVVNRPGFYNSERGGFAKLTSGIATAGVVSNSLRRGMFHGPLPRTLVC